MNAGPQKNPRKSAYTPEIGERICELLADGASLRDIAAVEGMPPRATICRWAWDDELSDQEFTRRYARARETQAHSEFDDLKDLENEVKEGTLDPRAGQVVMDDIKWRLSKMLPQVYGERQHIEHSGTIKHETVKDMAPEWMAERLAAPAAQVDEAEEGETVH